MAIHADLMAAHHDGSETFVPQQTPQLGQVVPVKVWLSKAGPYDDVALRTMVDGEQEFFESKQVGEDSFGRTFEMNLPMNSPVMNYRFMLLDHENSSYDWLNAREITSVEPSDVYDFQLTIFGGAPAWARGGPIYQIFPDRFARSSGADAHEVPDWATPREWTDPVGSSGVQHGYEFYGGDLDGIIEHLDHIVDLGVRTIYLTPIFPAGSAHRYDAATFDSVDPVLGGDEALVRLTAAAHERGLRVIGDLTTNHTGIRHEWFQRALQDENSEEKTYYLWHEYPEEHVGWLGHRSLPKLDWNSPALRRRLAQGPDSVVAKWMSEPFNLDGWRIDVANMTGRFKDVDLAHEVAKMVHDTAVAADRDALVAGEHFFDASEDLSGEGWMSTMNYSGFSRPVWSWLLDPNRPVSPSLGFMPMPMPQRSGQVVAASMREFAARIPWQVLIGQWNILGSHDTARIRTQVGSRAKMIIAVGLMVTYPGTPMIFAGDEWELEGTFGEDSRVPMPWDDADQQNPEMHDVYRQMLRLKTNSPALQHGGMHWVLESEDAIGFLRECETERLLVIAARQDWEGADVSAAVLQTEDPEQLFGDGKLSMNPDGSAKVSGNTGISIWRL